jgi:cobalt-zinc-cadmium efflux system outer membrane protein
MAMTYARRALFGSVLAALVRVASADELGANLESLLNYAREHNPELRMRALEAEAAHAGAGAASALPDPSFQIMLMDFTNAESGSSASLLPGDVGATRYQIVQPLPFFGKRDLRGQLAGHQAAQRDATRDATRLDIESRIKTAYARYYQAAGEAGILNETRELYESLEKLVVTRYSVGLVPQQDALQAQSEITSIKLDLIEAERKRREAAAVLNALLPRDTDAALATPHALPLQKGVPSLRTLMNTAFESTPELTREQANIDAAKNTQALTLRDRYPDFSLGLRDTRPHNGIQTWDVMLEVTIPLQQLARRDREAESRHMLEAAHASLDATRARIGGRLGETFAAFESSRDKAQLLRSTLLPQAQATLKAAEAGYETGQVNFNTLIEAERQILRVRLALLDAEVEAAVRLSELEQLTGSSL